jgi:UDP-glucose/GDP-mannose dehydrogenase family, UDP binding domain
MNGHLAFWHGNCSKWCIAHGYLVKYLHLGESIVKPFATAKFSQPGIGKAHQSVASEVDVSSGGQNASDTAICEALFSHFRGDLVDRRIAIWSQEYVSANECESAIQMRNVIDRLRAAGAQVAVHAAAEPVDDGAGFGDVEYCEDKWQAVRNADALLVMSERDEYPGVEPGMLRWHLKEAVVIDSCNCLDRDWMAFGDFDFYTLELLTLDAACSQQSSFPSAVVVSDSAEAGVLSLVKTRRRCQTLRPQFA